ncbi:MAG: DUF2829 domain-containing protein [Pseudomonadota bacterium]
MSSVHDNCGGSAGEKESRTFHVTTADAFLEFTAWDMVERGGVLLILGTDSVHAAFAPGSWKSAVWGEARFKYHAAVGASGTELPAGAPGVVRERRPNGDDTCSIGHKYPSARALGSPANAKDTVLYAVPHDIGWAMRAVSQGGRVRRAGWRDSWLQIADAQRGWGVSFVEHPGDRETVFKTPAFLMLKTPVDDLVPWAPSHTDLLATDWEVVT